MRLVTFLILIIMTYCAGFGSDFIASPQTDVDKFFDIQHDNFYESSKQIWDKSKSQTAVSAPPQAVKQQYIKQRQGVVKHSKQFGFSLDSVLDAGAGLGEFSDYTLTPIFKNVDVVQRSENMLNKAKQRLGDRVRNFYHSSLQDFIFQHKYDFIVAKVVLMYMSDSDIIKFLQNAKRSLTETGVIMLLQPQSLTGQHFINKRLGAVFRNIKSWTNIYNKAGLQILSFKEHQYYKEENYKLITVIFR